MSKLYVGNLPYTTTEDELKAHFEQAGGVKNVTIVKDRDTGNSKGFGFVEMADEATAEQAMSIHDGKEFKGRDLKVNKARPKENSRRQPA